MDSNFFLKTTVAELSSEQKSVLNRKGNELFTAIFTTTGYSDGLTRVGDFFYQKDEKLTALRYYQLAHNRNNVDVIVKDIARLLQMMMEGEN